MALLRPPNVWPFKRDPGFPYFYKARPTREPYKLTNPIIGRVLAFDFLFSYRFAIKVQRLITGYVPKKAKTFATPGLTTEPYTKPAFPGIPRTGYQELKVQDVSKKVAIWLWDDYDVQKSAGTPYIKFDFPPKELSFDVGSSLKPIGIVGANYPHYHYTGSKEILTLAITWYGYQNDADSIEVKCRKLEALSKADGYRQGPKQIIIDWGGWTSYGDDSVDLLNNHVYTVQSANYKLNTFLANRQERGTVKSNSFKPINATQELVLVREANQLTSDQIINGVL